MVKMHRIIKPLYDIARIGDTQRLKNRLSTIDNPHMKQYVLHNCFMVACSHCSVDTAKWIFENYKDYDMLRYAYNRAIISNNTHIAKWLWSEMLDHRESIS